MIKTATINSCPKWSNQCKSDVTTESNCKRTHTSLGRWVHSPFIKSTKLTIRGMHNLSIPLSAAVDSLSAPRSPRNVACMKRRTTCSLIVQYMVKLMDRKLHWAIWRTFFKFGVWKKLRGHNNNHTNRIGCCKDTNCNGYEDFHCRVKARGLTLIAYLFFVLTLLVE